MVVLGIEHPDVVNSEAYDYVELRDWASVASEEEVKKFLAENFPQALEPIEVPDVEAESKSNTIPQRKAPAKKEVTEKTVEPKQSNVIDTVTGKAVDPDIAKQVEALTEGLDAFDD